MANPVSNPKWLKQLLDTRFFMPCPAHEHFTKNECNLYCTDCMGRPLCSICATQHKDHQIVQIRRSSYHNVVRLTEIQKVWDVSGVQTYVINSAKVVFLNERPILKPARGASNTCINCDRTLLDTFRYCSIGCKREAGSNDQGKSVDSELKQQPESSDSGEKRLIRKTTQVIQDPRTLAQDQTENKALSLEVSPPRTPPPDIAGVAAKRRKGIPQRAHLGM